MPVIDDKVSNASMALCRTCALCCRGDLFAKLDLEPGEPSASQQAAWDKAGLYPNADAHPPNLLQPCPALHERACTCYAQRPRACAVFRCRLLARYEQNECSWEEARQTIARMEQHLQRVNAKLAEHPAVTPAPFLQTLQNFHHWYNREASPEQVQHWQHLLIELQALLVLLQHHFLKT